MAKVLPSVLGLLLAASACGDDGDAVDIVVSTLDFGHTDCGTAAVPRQLTLTNESGESFTFTTALAAGADSYYTVTPAAGAVLPYGQLTLTVISKPIPAESAVTPNLYGDTLIVTTDREGDTPREVAITQTARGLVLEASTSAVTFANTLFAGQNELQAVTITNVGNVDAEISLTTTLAPAFTIDPVATQMIVPGGTVASMVRFSPGHTGENVASLTASMSGVANCGKPLEVSLSGVGSAKGMAVRAVPAVHRNRPRSAGGSSSICVQLTNGMVACGGANSFGMRGAPDEYLAQIPSPEDGKGGGDLPLPTGGIASLDVVNFVQTKTGFLDGVQHLVAGNGFYCGRRSAGDVWCWGDKDGLGGAADPVTRYNPLATRVIASGATKLAAGYFVRCITSGANDTLTCTTNRATSNNFVQPTWTVDNADDIATAGGAAYAVVGGEVYSFGLNRSGERGYNGEDQAPGAAIPSFTGVEQVIAGGRGLSNRSNRFGCARKADGSVWCWGDNQHGQLGDGTTNSRTTPVQVIDLDDNALADVEHITAGMSHACAVASGAVWCWGRGLEGQLGSGNTSQNVSRAEPVTGLTNVSTIEASGTRTTCAVLTNKAVRCWGQALSQYYLAPTPLFVFEP